MPGDPRPICQRPPVKQQSTGQAGPEVNRDLEVLFAAVNAALRCNAALSELVQQLLVTPAAQPDGLESGLPPLLRVPLSANYTVPGGFTGIILANSTGAYSITLPPPRAGCPIELFEVGGTDPIVVKDDAGTTIGTMVASSYTRVVPAEGSTGTQAWPTGLVAQGFGGTLYPADVVVSAAADGFIWLDSAGHWWRATIATTGALTTADLGTSMPPEVALP